MGATPAVETGGSSLSADKPYEPSSVWFPRAIFGACITTGVLVPSLYNPLISSIYSYLYQSTFYRISSIETIETILSYIIFEIIYNVKFFNNPHLRIDIRGPPSKDASPKLPNMRWPSARVSELFVYVIPILMLDFTMVKKYAGVPVTDLRISGGYKSVAVQDISPSFLVPTFHNFSLASPLQLERALPPSPPSTRRLLMELGTSIFIYDTLFFALHLALHRIPLLARYHKTHHRHGEMNPQITNQLSVFERLSLVLLANFSLNVIGSHVLTRTVFIPMFVWLLIEIHSGMDLKWSYDKLLPKGWGTGSRKHAMHHRGLGEEGGFAPFFCWWDGALNYLEGKYGGDLDVNIS